jgi:hypothetical protein
VTRANLRANSRPLVFASIGLPHAMRRERCFLGRLLIGIMPGLLLNPIREYVERPAPLRLVEGSRRALVCRMLHGR